MNAQLDEGTDRIVAKFAEWVKGLTLDGGEFEEGLLSLCWATCSESGAGGGGGVSVGGYERYDGAGVFEGRGEWGCVAWGEGRWDVSHGIFVVCERLESGVRCSRGVAKCSFV